MNLLDLAIEFFSNLKVGFSVKESAMFLNIAHSEASKFLFDDLSFTQSLSLKYVSEITGLEYELSFRGLGINPFTENECLTFSNRESNFIKYGLKFVSLLQKTSK